MEESKLDEHDIIKIPEYTYFSKPRKTKYFKKSGGIGVFFIRNIYLNHIEILDTDCEYFLGQS